MKNQFSKFSLLAFLLLATGKAMAEPPDLSIQKLDPIKVKYATKDKYGDFEITEESIAAAMAQQLTNEAKIKYKTDGQRPIETTQGLRVSFGNKKISFNYSSRDIHWDYKPGFDKEFGQFLTIPIGYTSTTNQDSIELEIVAPEKGIFRERKSIFMSPKIDSVPACLADFANAFPSAQKTVVSGQRKFGDEINTPYKPESVFANFKRNLTPSAKQPQESGVLTGTFIYAKNELRTNVVINVFPYRDGSKVVFSASFPYKLYPDGRISGTDLIEPFIQDMKKIASD